ncbi:MAG: phosphatase PAP2 family protein [Actinomycetota bacterium]|nr:phosphatase PAP2 family protein [Actinomycetota bacterium]
MRASRAIRASAWALVAAGVAAPLLRRRVRLAPAAVMLSSGLAPAALAVATGPGRRREVGICALNMWAYLAAYELPHDDPQRLAERVWIDYPIVADRILGLGVPPTVSLQHRFSRVGQINRFERVLVWCHWIWFMVPHASLAYVLARRPERFSTAAVRMYAVFDLGATFYWAVPTAPPWYAAQHRRLGPAGEPPVRRMMIEYGEEFWGGRWPALYDVLGGNPLAAMPSLHFATSLMGAHLLSEVGPAAGAVGFTYTALLGLALVYLGEHYASDLLGGAALAEAIRYGAPRAAPLAQRLAGGLQTLQARAATR